MRIFKVSKVHTFLLGIIMMTILLSCSSYVQASQSGDYFNVSDKETKIIDYLPNSVSGEKGVRFLSRDQSGNYIDMIKNTFGYPNWLWVTPNRQYPNIWNIDLENEKIAAHPSAVVGSGHVDLDSIVAVKLNNDFGNINVTGFAGNDNKGQVKHYIYIGENGYLNPLWESESGGAFNINVPYKNGDHLYFAVDAKDDDYYDWAYWQNIRIKGGTTSNVGRSSFFLLVANDPSQGDYLDTGIYVNESESYRITSTGRARCDDSQNYTDPDGNLWTGASKQVQKADPNCIITNAPIGALIGAIKDSGGNRSGKYILGSSTVGMFKASGTLMLAYNDYPGQYKDNSGAYFVTIEKITTNTSASSPPINRLAGFDRYETASQIAKSGWSQSDYAVLAYGENFPDALASAPLAKKFNAPILLTTSNSLPSTTKQALTSLQVKNVLIIGGTGVIYSSIDSELQSMGITITRIAGQTQYDTAIKVAEQLPSPSSVFVCTGEDYTDALSVAPIAAMKQIPIILVSRDSVPDSVKSYLSSHNITKTYVIGYSDIVSDNVYNQLPNPERIVGGDKYARNIAVNQKFNNDFKPDSICVATGEGFADALTGTAYSAKISEPIILINNDSSANTKSYYQQRLANANNIYIFGGTGIIADTVIQGLNSK